MIDITPTVSLLEALWTLLALIGIAVNARGYTETSARVQYLVGAGINGVYYALALDHRRQEAVEATAQTLFLVAGISALTTPPRPDSGGWLPAAVGLILLLVEGLLVLRALQRQVVRDWVERLADAEGFLPPPGEDDRHGGNDAKQ